MAPPRKHALVTACRIREVLDYDRETGIFRWKVRLSPRGVVGAIAGSVKPSGYRDITIDGVNFPAHRLAWLHHFGQWPDQWIDHINRNRDDNRIANLRDVSPTWNRHNTADSNRNNKTGMLGVVLSPNRTRYISRISFPGKKNLYLGTFDTPEEAHAAFMRAKTIHQAGAGPER